MLKEPRSNSRQDGKQGEGMKLIVNERNGCCESIQIEYTPTEALIINQAMRRYVNDEEVNEDNRKVMKQMLDVEPIFVDLAGSEE